MAVASRKAGKYDKYTGGFPNQPDFNLEIAWLESKGFYMEKGAAPTVLTGLKGDVYCYSRNKGWAILGVKYDGLSMVFVHTYYDYGYLHVYGYIDSTGKWKDLRDFEEYRDCIIEERLKN
jgi:hypothetical protein